MPLDAVLDEELRRLRAAIARVASAAEFLSGPFFQAELIRAAERAAAHAQATLLCRRMAADVFFTSESEIDRAANAGAFPRHYRAGTPMFSRTEIEEAITGGRWARRTSKGESGPQS